MGENRAMDFSHGEVPQLGVLVTNLGTPDAPTPAALRRYLKQFLWDRRVVDVPRPLWWLILNGIILRTRPARSAAAYRTVWTDEGSPLLRISQRQAEALQTRLAERLPGPVTVALGMRYGNPSIASALERLRRGNVQRLLVLPLYPQYSSSTTASTLDAVSDALRGGRWMPELRMVSHYHDDEGYIEALAASVEEKWRREGRAERLLLSFHGTPRRFLYEGDPYFCECHKTARLVAQRLGLDEQQWALAFQSRFGREVWLQPYTDEVLKQWAADGVKSVEAVCPGFSADCLETLEEVAEGYRDLFLEVGGERFDYIPALNDRDDHIAALLDIIDRHCSGWPEAALDYDLREAELQAEARTRRYEAERQTGRN